MQNVEGQQQPFKSSRIPESIDLLTLRTTLNTASVPFSQEARLLYLLIELLPNSQLPAQRAPVNLVLIVDASESMLIPALDDDLVEELGRRGLLVEMISDGVPVFRVLNMPADLLAHAKPVCSMDYVKTALSEVTTRLDANDRISLIAFGRNAKTLVANCSAGQKKKILDCLGSLASGEFGDDTYLTNGLELGLHEAVSGHAQDRLTRLLLLTDGFAADEQQAAQVAAQVAQHGFGLSTVGLGTTFNEGFLIGLAENSGGNAHLVFQPSDIPAVFAAEFESSRQVLLRSLNFRLALTQGVEVRRAYRVQPLISELVMDTTPHDRSLALNLGDLNRDQPMALLLELICPPRLSGDYRLAQTVITGESPLTGKRIVVRGDVLLQITDAAQGPEPADSRVMKLVEAVSTFKLQTQALADAAAGNTAGATRKLEAVATRLLADGDTEMAEMVQAEMDNLEHEGAMSQAGAKTLRYETRKLTQKLDG